MKKNILFIGVIGQIRAGKTTVANGIINILNEKHMMNDEEFKIQQFEFSGPLRSILRALHIDENSRPHLQTLGNILRDNFGKTTISEAVAQDILKSDCDVAVVSGVRMKTDLSILNHFPDSHILIYVKADIETRLFRENLENAKNNRPLKSMEQFLIEAQARTEVEIEEISKQADYIIDNSSDITTLTAQLVDVVNLIQKTYPV